MEKNLISFGRRKQRSWIKIEIYVRMMRRTPTNTHLVRANCSGKNRSEKKNWRNFVAALVAKWQQPQRMRKIIRRCVRASRSHHMRSGECQVGAQITKTKYCKKQMKKTTAKKSNCNFLVFRIEWVERKKRMRKNERRQERAYAKLVFFIFHSSSWPYCLRAMD